MTHTSFSEDSRANAIAARNAYVEWFNRLTGRNVPRCTECSARLPLGWACAKCGTIQDEYNWIEHQHYGRAA